MPHISVILPVFNAAAYVRQAVESVLAQTFSDFELVVIDDGSTDGSDRLLSELARMDSRIRLLAQENQGYSRTLNTAFQLAGGEFIARMDADDICLPMRFELQRQFLTDHPEIGVVGSRVLLIDPEGAPVCESFLEQHHEEIDRCHMAFCGSAIAHPSVLIRASLLGDVGGYRTEFEPAEDLDLWLRLAERTRLANIPQALLKYRLLEKSVSHTRRSEQRDKMIRAVDEAHSRRRSSHNISQNNGAAVKAALPPRIQWARMAFDAGEISNARVLARKAILRHPAQQRAWRSLAASLLGKPRTFSTDRRSA